MMHPNQRPNTMTIAKYRPQATFVAPINELVNEFFGPAFFRSTAGRHPHIGQYFGHDDVKGSMPSVNILERENEFELRMLVPGLSKHDLKLNVEKDVLTISAETRAEEKKENERYTRREFTRSAFSRSFRLPETVNVETIKAEHADGVLTVTIPKAEMAKPKAREITIG